MFVLKYFKTTPRSPYGGRQALSVIFFSSNLQRGSWEKKTRGHVAPPTGDRGLSPTPGVTTSHPKSAALWVRSRMQLSG